MAIAWADGSTSDYLESMQNLKVAPKPAKSVQKCVVSKAVSALSEKGKKGFAYIV